MVPFSHFLLKNPSTDARDQARTRNGTQAFQFFSELEAAGKTGPDPQGVQAATCNEVHEWSERCTLGAFPVVDFVMLEGYHLDSTRKSV